MSGRAGVFALLVAGALVLASAPSARAGSEEDPFSQLDEERKVLGASKRLQPLSETPSSVTIITAAEIRANGYHTVGEALRWVRGLYVTNDRNYTYVGTRGLLRPGDYNNKVLLAVDGHTVNGNVYGEAYFGEELGIDLERVERIEVVRGPSSSLYGGFAALAIVNVVLRPPHREPGVTVAGRASAPGERRAFLELASARPGRPEWSLSASVMDARGADLYFPAYDSPLTGTGRVRDGDGERAGALLGAVEWNALRLTVKFNQRMKHVPTGAFGVLFGDSRNRSYDGHDFVELSTHRSLSPALEVHGRTYWDGSRYHGYFIYGPDSAAVVNVDHGDGDVAGSEVRALWSADESNVVTFGAEGQYHFRARMENYDQDPYALYVWRDVRRGVGALYAQDEIRLGNSGHVTAGARLDGDSYLHTHVVSPRLDVVWNSGPETTWKLLAGSAFRPPSLYESEYEDGYSQLRNPQLGSEHIATVEGVMERRAGPFQLTLSAYASRIRDLIDLVPVDSSRWQFQNRARANARGLEGEVQCVGSDGLRARLAAAVQRSTDVVTGAELTNSPRWNAHLVLTRAPAEQRWTLGAGFRFLSPRLTLSGRHTEPAMVLDTRVSRWIARSLLAGLEVKNLADARYGDPASSEHRQDEIPQDPRTFYLTISYHGGADR